jgi:hypothetical protein
MNQVPSIISNEANVDIEVRRGDTGGEYTDQKLGEVIRVGNVPVSASP